jgi:hypothetical protein
MNKNYRLIWFQHLRKVAGSTIVRLAEANQEVLYPQHTNGNPRTIDGKLIHIWEMDTADLVDFIDQCEQEGITFISTEWSAPDLTTLASDPRIILITCIRDPLERFLSEYYYSLYKGRTDRRSLKDFVNSTAMHSLHTLSMFNYYCRIFSRYNDHPEPVGPEQFERASTSMALFDHCAVLDEKDPFAEFHRLLGWSISEVTVNRTVMDWSLFGKLLIKGHLHQLLRRLANPRKEPSEDYRRHFREQNQWDYRLYQEARKKLASVPS